MSDGETPDPEPTFATSSGIPLKAVYGPDDLAPTARAAAATQPGAAPFLRGAYAGMYRSKPWRIFQLSGFGSPKIAGERIRQLLEHGETGFIIEHDRNTGDHLYDADHPYVLARREDLGLNGAVVQSVRDFETILDQIPIETTYGHAGGGPVQAGPWCLAGYWAVARRRGLDLSRLPGTGQSDFFLTYLACVTKQQVPTAAGLRFNADIIEFCAEHMPRWVPVSIAGYNGADTGLNAWQELGAVFANAIEYLDEIKRRGRISLAQAAQACGGVSFRVGMDLFEDICKLRAGRKVWSDLLERRYGVRDEKAQRLRVHSLTSGLMMQYAQPLNNIARGSIMALAGVLGGTQSLGVSGYDEALSIPSDHAHQMSIRIQQILQNESNLCAVADPLGGSYFIEALTAEIEARAWAFMEEIEAQGGFLATLDSGWLHARAAENQTAIQARLDSGEDVVVGLNAFTDDISPFTIDGFKSSSQEWEQALERLKSVRAERDQTTSGEALRELERVCRDGGNIMPAMIETLHAEATIGEVGSVFRETFGDWSSPVL